MGPAQEGHAESRPTLRSPFNLIPIQLDSLGREKAFEEAKRLIDAGSMT